MSEGDANVVRPSLRAGVPCPPVCSTPTACSGSGAYAGCAGVYACGPTTYGGNDCVAYCDYAPRAQAEVCDGLDNNCNRQIDENGAALCDDGLDCSVDTCSQVTYFGSSYGYCSSPTPSTCQEVRRPVGESRIDTDGTWLMRRDNPRLTGRAVQRVASEIPRPAGQSCCATRTIEGYGYLRPTRSGVLQYDTFPNTFGPNSSVIYSDNVVGAAATSGAFRAPGMTLHMGAAPVDIGLHVRGPTAPFPPALVPQDSVRMRLDPRVLVLPVRITVFTNGSAIPDASPISALSLQRMFDPGASEHVATNTPTNYLSREIYQPAPPVPDDIWTQCDIQFRLEATRHVVNTSLANILATTCACSGAQFEDGIDRGNLMVGPTGIRTQLAQYIDANGGSNVNLLDAFIGGALATDLTGCGATLGGPPQAFACGPSNGCSGNFSPTAPGGARFSGMLFVRSVFSSRAFAHEVGHMLWLGHSPGDTVGGGGACVANDFAGITPLMYGSGGATGTDISPNQCGHARCQAAEWLRRLGRMSQTERDFVCAGN